MKELTWSSKEEMDIFISLLKMTTTTMCKYESIFEKLNVDIIKFLRPSVVDVLSSRTGCS
jgi:hypothetical protein